MSKANAEFEREWELKRDEYAARDGLKQVPRRPELLALEGWYEYEDRNNRPVRFKLTCRFRDLLRCSIWRGHRSHFTSCFAPGGAYSSVPWWICSQRNLAMVYLPDKHGNFQSRAWVQYEDTEEIPELTIYKIYGNGLEHNKLAKVFTALSLRCTTGEWDIPY